MYSRGGETRALVERPKWQLGDKERFLWCLPSKSSTTVTGNCRRRLGTVIAKFSLQIQTEYRGQRARARKNSVSIENPMDKCAQASCSTLDRADNNGSSASIFWSTVRGGHKSAGDAKGSCVCGGGRVRQFILMYHYFHELTSRINS